MIKAFFNERADNWDKNATEQDTSKLEQMAARLKIETGATVLDVGTGTGIFLPYLLKKVGAKGNIIALDIAEKMLAKAKSKGFKGNIRYLCADVMSIPMDGEFCDAVVCYSSLPHFPDKPKAMLEMKRILKKGGRVFICHTSSREHINHIHHSIPVVQNDLLPDAIEMTMLLSNAGFTEIQVEDTAESYLACGRKPW
ncbi:MAG: class I SAM-dependent methyltransferase [Dehalococcoidales bacterium]|nr:class I SAM-dependent methyltransferase [Dehalococcoidales bacterium]